MNHYLKIRQPHYLRLKDGSKNCEIRINDRDFQTGDHLIFDRIIFSEGGTKGDYLPEHAILRVKVKHVLSDVDGLSPEYVALSIQTFDPKFPQSKQDEENDAAHIKHMELLRELQIGPFSPDAEFSGVKLNG